MQIMRLSENELTYKQYIIITFQKGIIRNASFKG